MSKFSDFKVGDLIKHKELGDWNLGILTKKWSRFGVDMICIHWTNIQQAIIYTDMDSQFLVKID